MPEKFVMSEDIVDIKVYDKVAIVMLCSVLVLLGWFPGLMAPLVSSGVTSVMAVLGGV